MPRVTKLRLLCVISELENRINELEVELRSTRVEATHNRSMAKMAEAIRARNDFESDRYAALHAEYAHERVARYDESGKLREVLFMLRQPKRFTKKKIIEHLEGMK